MSENNSCAAKRRAHGELASGEGRSSHAEMQGSGPATTMPAAVKPRLPPRQSRLEERPPSLGRNHVQGPDRSGGGPVEGGAGADKGEPGGPAPSGKASGAPGRTQLHGRQGGQQRRTGSLDAGPGVTSLGHPAKRASRGGLSALQMPTLSAAPGGKERALLWPSAGCTCSLAPPHLQGPGLHSPSQDHVSSAGRCESRPPEWDVDRPSDAVSCPSDNCSELPERTRSDPLILRLSGEHKG